jgi:hypothetical protein
MEPISLQEALGEMEYVALETLPECLIDDLPGLQRPVATENDIFIASGFNIFRFGRDGKFLNRIGSEGRGPGEFLSVTGMCVNERTEEVFLYDVLSKTILVYGYDGKHKRSIGTDRSTSIMDMIALSDSTLLVANRSSSSDVPTPAFDPFMLISSLDGRLLKSPVPPHKDPNAYSDMSMEQFRAEFSDKPDSSDGFKGLGSGAMVLMDNSQPAILWQSNSIYLTEAGVELSEYVADTVWVVSGTGALTPRWIKSPPAMASDIPQRRYGGLRLETDRYALFSTMGFGGAMGYRVDKTDGTVTQTYLYDANLDHEQTRRNRIIAPQVNTGRFAMPYQPLHLLEWLEQGKLSGPLGTLAATLEEADNPVIMIQKQ